MNVGKPILMKLFRISLYSFSMVVANFVAIYCGFIVNYLLKSANQITIQLPIAIILSVTFFLLWILLMQLHIFKRFVIKEKQDLFSVYIFALILNPVLYIPLHYITQGYLTSFGNVFAIWMFQLLVNLISIITAWLILKNINNEKIIL